MSKAMRIIQAGMGCFGRNWCTTKVAPSPEVEAVAFVDASADARECCVREIVSAIREGREPITAGALNIGSIGLTYAAIEASETEGWVTVER
ncbi:MAG: hypothetical protein ACLFP4_00825 [Spirochaetales bacterium]